MSILSNGYLLALTSVSNIAFDAEFLVIAGGGSSGSAGVGNNKYGGGAGGYISSISGESSGGGASALSPVNLETGSTTYSVTVGAANSDSIFSGTDTAGSSFNHTADAGGTGLAGNGGSGSGGGVKSLPGGSGTANQGFDGGTGGTGPDACYLANYFCHYNCDNFHGGGGGGAGAAASGRNGGIGVQSSVTGTATYYAGGGGGANTCGTASQKIGTPGSGYTNYGGGGHNGSAGQDGVVILKYPTTVAISNTGGGLTMSTSVVSGNNVTVITAGTGNIEFTPA